MILILLILTLVTVGIAILFKEATDNLFIWRDKLQLNPSVMVGLEVALLLFALSGVFVYAFLVYRVAIML